MIMRRILSLLLLLGACAAPQPAAVNPPPAQAAPAPAPASAPPALEFGSLRHAVAALPAPTAGERWTYFAGPWLGTADAELAESIPGVRVVTGLTREQALERAAEAHGVDGFYATPAFLEKAAHLAWVQAMSSGVERYLTIPALAADAGPVLTNVQGSSGPAIADHAFAMLLTLSRGLRDYARAQTEARWSAESSGDAFALQDKTLLVVGLGGIGGEIARRGYGFGMRIIATRRSDAPAPDYVARLGRSEDLLGMLPEADVVAIAVPLTPETAGLFDAAAFAAMKPGAILINVARGRIVDTGALLEALRSGRLGGACLDVTDPEPLPADHPLWREPRVLITPHVAADSALSGDRAAALLRENLRRFGAGEPLFNVVDKKAGY